MLLPSTMFERNPGLETVSSDVRIGFQPEIGSISAPTYEGLLRFMSVDEAQNGFPKRNSSAAAGSTWDFYKFQPWTTPISGHRTYDHVYSYFGPDHPMNASEWCAAAQLAAHVQYMNLINGFVRHSFEYTTAVILWKTQSPWPALRGFLYDWYLESTGTLRGTRAALQSPISVVLDQSSWRLCLVNRRIFPLQSQTHNNESIGAKYAWINLNGTVVSSGEMLLTDPFAIVPAMSVALLGTDVLRWPEHCTEVCFLRLEVIPSFIVRGQPSWLWLTDPKLGKSSDYSVLGSMRLRHAGSFWLSSSSTCIVSDEDVVLWARIEVAPNATEVLFYPTLALSTMEGQPILPILDDHESNVVLLPGDVQTRRIVSPRIDFHGSTWHVLINLRSWNAPSIVQKVTCRKSRIKSTSVL